MICESELPNGYYWVFFDNKWNICHKNKWWFSADDIDNLDNQVNGCVCVPIKEPSHQP